MGLAAYSFLLFALQVAVELPDVKGRKEILDYYLYGKPVASDVNSELIARRTPGMALLSRRGKGAAF